jgi:hypothetical protein
MRVVVERQFTVKHAFESARKTVIVFGGDNKKSIGFFDDSSIARIFALGVIAVTRKIELHRVGKRNCNIFDFSAFVGDEMRGFDRFALDAGSSRQNSNGE